MIHRQLLAVSAAAALVGLTGCAGQPPPARMAPPVAMQQPAAPPVAMQQPGAPPMGAMPAANGAQAQGVYDWRDVPRGQQVPVSHASFDQGGYQVYAATGETIVVP